MKIDSILPALNETQTMNYQQIVNLGIRRQDARKRLDKLIQRGLVKEEGRENWKHGKSLHYSLTKKGQALYFSESIRDVENYLEVIRKILKTWRDDPTLIREWRSNLIESIPDLEIFRRNNAVPVKDDQYTTDQIILAVEELWNKFLMLKIKLQQINLQPR